MNAPAPSAQLATTFNPLPLYAAYRQQAPIIYDQALSSWLVVGYDDVKRILTDHRTFSSQIGAAINPDSPVSRSLVTSDPPRHRSLRDIVNKAFTPRRVEMLAPRIAEIAHECLDRVAGQGHMEFLDDFAVPLPVIVIAELLGVPVADRADFKRWSDAQVRGEPAGMREMSAYFTRLIDERRHIRRDDLISVLLDAEVEGERLDTDSLLGFCVLLLVAGNETTTNLLANAVLLFSQFPEQYERLRAEPALLPDAIEEVLRYYSPIQARLRRVVQDTEIGGQLCQAGEQVLAHIGAANHDPAQFAAPDVFDIARAPNRHLAFGYGIHFCLGAPLARLEGRVALQILLDRMPGLRVAPDTTLARLPVPFLFGLKSLPVVF